MRKTIEIDLVKFLELKPEVKRCIQQEGIVYGFEIDSIGHMFCSAINIGDCPLTYNSNKTLPYCMKRKYELKVRR